MLFRSPQAGTAEAAGWSVAMPDVFSIRHTTVEDYVEPVVHEIKVNRADLLSDLRQAPKREAYRAIASQCWYVLQAGIGTADEIPAEYGVMLAHGDAGVASGETTCPSVDITSRPGGMGITAPSLPCPRKRLPRCLAKSSSISCAIARPPLPWVMSTLPWRRSSGRT